MSREVTEAHYLHERSGLEAVLRPPVKHPTALAWVPKREELVVTTREGEIISVDPVLGTRVIADGIGESAVLSLHDDRKRFLVMSRQGTWRVGTLKGEIEITGKHDFLGAMSGFFASDYVVMTGDMGDGKRVLQIYKGEKRVANIRLPPRVSATLSDTSDLLLCRSTDAGLEVLALNDMRKGKSFQKGLEATIHRLRPSGPHILGFTTTGICLWGQAGGQPRSMRLPDLTAGDISENGNYLGLGTRNGAVALARIDNLEKRIRPDLVRAFNSPVTSVAFSQRGRWLATGAEGLRIWSWED
ncbi:MAG: hypothetical protein R3F61_05065 [Myxococcota bacterium]